MRKLFAAPQFRRDFRKLPAEMRRAVDVVAQRLLVDPLNLAVHPKKLKGIMPATWRVRIGAYRLMYAFTITSLILLRIAHRKDIYR